MTIENSAPAIESVSLSPSEVYTNDNITANVSVSDEDGDDISLSYAWYVDGSVVAETGSSLDGALLRQGSGGLCRGHGQMGMSESHVT